MEDRRQLASALIRALAFRIVDNPAPTWPLPIFEAEADLYPDFLCALLAACDALQASGATENDLARRFRTPTRIVELSYFLLGARHSGLDLAARRRLAVHLATALSCARPADPLCQTGANRLLAQPDVARLASAQRPAVTPAKRLLMARLRAALLSLAEIIHVGIPQYGREVHGPYPVAQDQFMIVHEFLDFSLPEVWPATGTFPIESVRIAETYHGPHALVTFDISNHMTTPIPLRDRLAGTAIEIRPKGAKGGGIQAAGGGELLAEVLALHSRLASDSQGFSRSEWLRQHRRSRYHYLKPLMIAGEPAQPGPPEAQGALRPGEHVMRMALSPASLSGMSPEQLHGQLCADLGLTAEAS